MDVNGSEVVPAPPVMLFPTRIAAGGVDRGAGRQYDLAPDGRFLINTELNGFQPHHTCCRTGTPPVEMISQR